MCVYLSTYAFIPLSILEIPQIYIAVSVCFSPSHRNSRASSEDLLNQRLVQHCKHKKMSQVYTELLREVGEQEDAHTKTKHQIYWIFNAVKYV